MNVTLVNEKIQDATFEVKEGESLVLNLAAFNGFSESHYHGEGRGERFISRCFRRFLEWRRQIRFESFPRRSGIGMRLASLFACRPFGQEGF
jgi:hypothetical protein